MYWRRSLDWLVEHYPQEQPLFYRFARNAYLKTRNEEGDLAYARIPSSQMKKSILRAIYQSRAFVRDLVKNFFLFFNQ